MPRKRTNELVVGQFFAWKLFERQGVYWADGRSNAQSAGRHSLGTRDRQVALENLRQLDQIKAVELGLADEAILHSEHDRQLLLDDGVGLYKAHVLRPAVTGGASPDTWKRYRAIFDKFLPHLKQRHIQTWNQVRRTHLEDYAAWLDGEGYAYRTEFCELTTIKQCVKWLVEEGHLPPECLVKLPLAKPTGTDTYCWRPEEVAAILQRCREERGLNWLEGVLTCLACTGMRISELAGLRWSDVDRQANHIILPDETACRRRTASRAIRQTKSRRSRSFPVHPNLLAAFNQMARAEDGHVFHGPKGGTISPDIVRRTLIKQVLKPLADRFPSDPGEVGFLDGRLHSFRHYFCSTCANSNVPEQLLMEWLGHRESKMVRHYYHVHDAEAQRQMERLKFIGGAAE